MTSNKKNRIRQIYRIALSGVIVIAGLYLIQACVGIYRSGDAPFSREAVATAFSGIALPVYLCLAMIAGGFILEFLLPGNEQKSKPQKQYALILRQLHADLPNNDLAIHAEQKKRRILRCITAGLLVVGGCVFLIYALDTAHYSQTDINGSMVKAILLLLPCMAVPFGFGVFTAYRCRKSMQREIELLKQAGAKTRRIAPAPAVKKGNFAAWSILAVAAVLLVYGFCAGGTMDVLTKAINICTECVGLG